MRSRSKSSTTIPSSPSFFAKSWSPLPSIFMRCITSAILPIWLTSPFASTPAIFAVAFQSSSASVLIPIASAVLYEVLSIVPVAMAVPAKTTAAFLALPISLLKELPTPSISRFPVSNEFLSMFNPSDTKKPPISFFGI